VRQVGYLQELNPTKSHLIVTCFLFM